MQTTSIPFGYDETWKQTVAKGPLHSRHFLIAGCFNILVFLNVVKLYLGLRYNSQFGPYVPEILLLVIFLTSFGGYYAYQTYQLARSFLNAQEVDERASKLLLLVSFFSYRTYLILLTITFVLLASANVAVGHL